MVTLVGTLVQGADLEDGLVLHPHVFGLGLVVDVERRTNRGKAKPHLAIGRESGRSVCISTKSATKPRTFLAGVEATNIVCRALHHGKGVGQERLAS